MLWSGEHVSRQLATKNESKPKWSITTGQCGARTSFESPAAPLMRPRLWRRWPRKHWALLWIAWWCQDACVSWSVWNGRESKTTEDLQKVKLLVIKFYSLLVKKSTWLVFSDSFSLGEKRPEFSCTSYRTSSSCSCSCCKVQKGTKYYKTDTN